jgi:uncharacterized protein (TIGR02452 family)
MADKKVTIGTGTAFGTKPGEPPDLMMPLSGIVADLSDVYSFSNSEIYEWLGFVSPSTTGGLLGGGGGGGDGIKRLPQKVQTAQRYYPGENVFYSYGPGLNVLHVKDLVFNDPAKVYTDLAEAYENVFKGLAMIDLHGSTQVVDPKGRPKKLVESVKVLRLPPLGMTKSYGYNSMPMADLTFAAIAAAFHNLSEDDKNRIWPGGSPDDLRNWRIEICPAACDEDVRSWQNIWMDRSKAATQLPELGPNGGEFPKQGYGNPYKWIRTSKDETDRSTRRAGALLTLRAADAGGYRIDEGASAADPVATKQKPPSPHAVSRQTSSSRSLTTVNLSEVKYMIDNTVLIYGDGTDGTGRPRSLQEFQISQSRPRAGILVPAESHMLVLDVAEELARVGRKVAVVSAASAYHAGGGMMTGGRHALEEATCMQSTLYRSLEKGIQLAKADNIHTPDWVRDGDKFHMHLPEKGVLLSPSVEVFRGGSDAGYRFKPEKVTLQAVVSMAMPNRNRHVRDSPLDAPRDLRDYENLVRSKLEATIHAGAYAGADTFVIPDVGCGVFQNDPRIVGRLLGEVLRTQGSYFEEIILTGKEEFMQSCFQAAGQEERWKQHKKSKASPNPRGGGAVPQPAPVGRSGEEPFPSERESRDAHSSAPPYNPPFGR